MLTEIQIEGYRAFERMTVAGLARVNLIVGKNNSGKTSLLEAVELVAPVGDHSVWFASPMRRGETHQTSPQRTAARVDGMVRSWPRLTAGEHAITLITAPSIGGVPLQAGI
jgi:recombinational DNA repair ATPase RecF